jgi:hypothetical protein
MPQFKKFKESITQSLTSEPYRPPKQFYFGAAVNQFSARNCIQIFSTTAPP